MSVGSHMGKARCGGKASREHSKQLVILGRISRACPFQPSVPPSTMGISERGSRLPSSSNSCRPVSVLGD